MAKFMKLLVVLIITFQACTTPEPAVAPAEPPLPIHQLFEESDIFSESITGFALYDPEADSMLYSRDADRFFTPASNTKILTLYAALKALPDTLPALRYVVHNDTLYFKGTGDPAFLNPNFDYHHTYNFLKERPETLVYYDGHFNDDHFGSGWSWDWYPAAYAPEKSPFPIYGNMMRLQTEQVALVQLSEENPVEPKFFERYIERNEWNGNEPQLVRRAHRENTILYTPRADTVSREQNVPFVYSSEHFTEMLSDTLGRDVHYTNRPGLEFSETLYGTPADTLYRRFMIVSDNFIAEQLLLMISEQEFGELNASRAIRHVLEHHFEGFSRSPSWSDGSGLTRYNLITPRFTVELLERLMEEFGEESTLSWFPAGGVSGTIRSMYRAPEGEPPYVYAKTGTLRNNTALSGYIYTDSGRRLNFSFLNNNYVISNHRLRTEMQNVLEFIKANY